MPVVDRTDYNAVERYFESFRQKYEQAFIRTLKYVALRVVTTARRKGSYLDQTGNLRSSVGAVIVIDGKILWSTNFEPAKSKSRSSPKGTSQTTATKKGGYDGRRFASELAKKYSSGVALIVVAGMDYAVHVANRGRDVLDSATLEAAELVPKMLAKLSSNKRT